MTKERHRQRTCGKSERALNTTSRDILRGDITLRYSFNPHRGSNGKMFIGVDILWGGGGLQMTISASELCADLENLSVDIGGDA